MQGQNRRNPQYMMQPGPTPSQVVVVGGGAGGGGGSNPIQQRVGAAAGNGGIPHPGDASHSMNNHSNSNGGNIPPRVLTQPTPLFERLVTEEVQELKAYARIIENQNRRLAELERVHGDLEARLELESRGRAQLETTLEEREREWAIKFRELEADRDHWKGVVKVEQTKNARLIDQVVRKDQGLHRMLQRKVFFFFRTARKHFFCCMYSFTVVSRIAHDFAFCFRCA